MPASCALLHERGPSRSRLENSVAGRFPGGNEVFREAGAETFFLLVGNECFPDVSNAEHVRGFSDIGPRCSVKEGKLGS